MLCNIHASKPVNNSIDLLYSDVALLIAVHYQLLYLLFDWYDKNHKWIMCKLVKILADKGNLIMSGLRSDTTNLGQAEDRKRT